MFNKGSTVLYDITSEYVATVRDEFDNLPPEEESDEENCSSKPVARLERFVPKSFELEDVGEEEELEFSHMNTSERSVQQRITSNATPSSVHSSTAAIKSRRVFPAGKSSRTEYETREAEETGVSLKSVSEKSMKRRTPSNRPTAAHSSAPLSTNNKVFPAGKSSRAKNHEYADDDRENREIGPSHRKASSKSVHSRSSSELAPTSAESMTPAKTKSSRAFPGEQPGIHKGEESNDGERQRDETLSSLKYCESNGPPIPFYNNTSIPDKVSVCQDRTATLEDDEMSIVDDESESTCSLISCVEESNEVGNCCIFHMYSKLFILGTALTHTYFFYY